MFLDKLKDFFIKKIVNKKLSNVKHIVSNDYIKSIGVIVDETSFKNKTALINNIVSSGVKNENIEIIVFRDNIKKSDTFNCPTFSYNSINWSANFNDKNATDFANKKFDLLVSYYDMAKSPLLLLTHLSKSNFKVGFANMNKKLNHFMIDTNAENYKVFTDELIKYLKILKKI